MAFKHAAQYWNSTSWWGAKKQPVRGKKLKPSRAAVRVDKANPFETCPDCGATVRRDHRKRHANRCPAARDKATAGFKYAPNRIGEPGKIPRSANASAPSGERSLPGAIIRKAHANATGSASVAAALVQCNRCRNMFLPQSLSEHIAVCLGPPRSKRKAPKNSAVGLKQKAKRRAIGRRKHTDVYDLPPGARWRRW